MIMKNRVVWLDRGWQPVSIGFCPSEKAWRREMKRLGCKGEAYPSSDGRCTRFEASKSNSECIIVTLRDGAERDHSLVEVAGLLVHEATHVWQFIIESIGEGKPSAELEAYSMQAIVQALMQAFDETRGLPK
ncbi:hypothetical protein ACFFHG_02945 [Gellertiella hungarica]